MSPTSFTKTILATILICSILTYGASLIGTNQLPPELQRQYPLCTILPSSIEFVQEEQAKYVGEIRLYWPKHSEVRILIMDGSEEARRKLMNYANEWALYSGLVFKRVYTIAASPQIRISFNCNGYNSLVGQQALDTLYEDLPTMCLQGLDQTKDEELFQRTVLHEFGHVMGLLHELQNPNVKIPWNLPKLYSYYKTTYDWDTSMVNKWILQPVDEENVDYSNFDPSSIMIYAIPDSLTNGEYSFGWPKTLSKIDRDKIKFYYN
jgi:hypothetical protein